MIPHDIHAYFEDVELNVIAASISDDTDGFCRQCQLTLYPSDFARLKMDDRQRGKEAVIKLHIDSYRFDFIAEAYSDNRAFVQKSYTVSGRSITARLSADYAKTQPEANRTLYARQLASLQLDLLPFKILNWQIVDWLIPEGSCLTSGKSPIDVLMEMAEAAGGFVESHPFSAELSIKPRYPVPIWDLGKKDADMIIPESVIISISGQVQDTSRANGVFVMGNTANAKGADVYRSGTDREPRASALTHALYTDAPVLRAAGIAALSATGKHKTETLTLPLSDKYGLGKIELGQVIQVNESSGHWRGIVNGTELSVTRENNAPVITQTITLDRYLDT